MLKLCFSFFSLDYKASLVRWNQGLPAQTAGAVGMKPGWWFHDVVHRIGKKIKQIFTLILLDSEINNNELFFMIQSIKPGNHLYCKCFKAEIQAVHHLHSSSLYQLFFRNIWLKNTVWRILYFGLLAVNMEILGTKKRYVKPNGKSCWDDIEDRRPQTGGPLSSTLPQQGRLILVCPQLKVGRLLYRSFNVYYHHSVLTLLTIRAANNCYFANNHREKSSQMR